MTARCEQDFALFLGKYAEIDFTVRTESGAVIDPTGKVYRWALATEAGQPAQVEKDSSVGPDQIELFGPPDNFVRVKVAAADTDALPAAWYYHELEQEDVPSKPETVAIGTVTAKQTTL